MPQHSNLNMVLAAVIAAAGLARSAMPAHSPHVNFSTKALDAGQLNSVAVLHTTPTTLVTLVGNPRARTTEGVDDDGHYHDVDDEVVEDREANFENDFRRPAPETVTVFVTTTALVAGAGDSRGSEAMSATEPTTSTTTDNAPLCSTSLIAPAPAPVTEEEASTSLSASESTAESTAESTTSVATLESADPSDLAATITDRANSTSTETTLGPTATTIGHFPFPRICERSRNLLWTNWRVQLPFAAKYGTKAGCSERFLEAVNNHCSGLVTKWDCGCVGSVRPCNNMWMVFRTDIFCPAGAISAAILQFTRGEVTMYCTDI